MTLFECMYFVYINRGIEFGLMTDLQRFQKVEEDHLEQMKQFLFKYMDVLQYGHNLIDQVKHHFYRFMMLGQWRDFSLQNCWDINGIVVIFNCFTLFWRPMMNSVVSVLKRQWRNF